MRQFVFFLEEPSAKEMLEGLLPKILPDDIIPELVKFDGKQALEKRLPGKLKSWHIPSHFDTKFIDIRDQDSGDCEVIKNCLVQKCYAAGKPDALVRIACRELESFYLGDLNAVAQAIGPENLGLQQHKSKYREPDKLRSPSRELKKLARTYQKLTGSRAIGKQLDPNKNRSASFRNLVDGIRGLV